MMNKKILQRIEALGGDVSEVGGEDLASDLSSIKFNCVLYPKTSNSPLATYEDAEPIFGISEEILKNKALYFKDKQKFFQMLIDKYYTDTIEDFGQSFWEPEPFTPFKEGSDDYYKWYDEFEENEDVDFSAVTEVTQDNMPELFHIAYSYGYPDSYYIALSDPNQQNPTVFGTDHEEFFQEVSIEGTLEDFFDNYMTKEEFLEIVKAQLKSNFYFEIDKV
ncbi:hypothetical protein FL857_00050 [Criibacterium bergeronii]|uniref:Uncharacterized protein n=2 Tax=Criibacterium bergeronii TaxID=1871336 RepID=A0A371IJ45_9FIRM|nr:hypothetical protein BBG48_009755 [Criibacterium bergeronii]TRW28511.1 hypothetical protein FL857_00050 [Criibacterium bergeronii]